MMHFRNTVFESDCWACCRFATNKAQSRVGWRQIWVRGWEQRRSRLLLRRQPLRPRSVQFILIRIQGGKKGKGRVLAINSAAYTWTREQKRFTISEVAADWHELMIPWRIMLSNFCLFLCCLFIICSYITTVWWNKDFHYAAILYCPR